MPQVDCTSDNEHCETDLTKLAAALDAIPDHPDAMMSATRAAIIFDAATALRQAARVQAAAAAFIREVDEGMSEWDEVNARDNLRATLGPSPKKGEEKISQKRTP
jgi:hypothetical protein